jgi:hypothetical protein
MIAITIALWTGLGVALAALTGLIAYLLAHANGSAIPKAAMTAATAAGALVTLYLSTTAFALQYLHS